MWVCMFTYQVFLAYVWFREAGCRLQKGPNCSWWELTSSLWNLREVLALLSHSELLHFKPDFQERIFGGFVPFTCTYTWHGPYYSQPSGNYHLEGWNHSLVLWSYDWLTSYIHTKRCSHASLLARSSTYMTTRGHMLAHMPLYSSISWWIWPAAVQTHCNQRKPVQTTMNKNRTLTEPNNWFGWT